MAAGQEVLAPAAIAVPLLTAAALAVVGRLLPRRLVDLLALGAALAVAGLLAMLLHLTAGGRIVTWSGGWTPHRGASVGIALVVDSVGAGVALMAAILVLAALVYSWHYFDAVEDTYHVLMLCFLAGMTGFALTGDLFDMFVFFELMGVVAYALTGYKIEEPQSVHGALSFAVVNSLGAYFTLTGIAMLYARAGELGLAALGAKLADKQPDALVVAAFVFVVTGFLVKAAVVPFHFWLADAHAVAPTPVCVLMSGVMVELGLYALARVYWTVGSGTLPAADFRRAFLVLGTATAILGAIMCVAQRHLKRMLAFSTVSHVGLFLVGIAVLAPAGLAGSALYIGGHAGVKSSLFLLTGTLLNRFESVDEGDLHGRGSHSRSLGVLWLVGGLALAGLPPFGLALGKGLVEHAASTAGYAFSLALFTFASALTGAAVLRSGLRVFFGRGLPAGQRAVGHRGEQAIAQEEPETGQPLGRLPLTMVLPAATLLVLALALGCVPGLAHATSRAAAVFTDRSGYAAQVLAGAPAPAPAGPAVQPWTAEGLVLGFISAALACLMAAAMVWAYRRPRWARLLADRVEPAMAWLHRLHSGHVGDYVAWLVAGVAFLAALVGLPLM